MIHPTLSLSLLILSQAAATATTASNPPPSAASVRASFLKRLDRPKVAPDVKVESKQTEADGRVVERLSFASEAKADGRMERVPVLVVSPSGGKGRLPAVIVLHGTGGNKDAMRPWLDELSRRGMMGVAIDARYHGDRAGGAGGATAYNEAIIRAWKAPSGSPQEHPFYYDTCWDLWRTLDYLAARDDVDARRIGMVGISMGGIETWLAGAADERVAVAVPAISVQSFRWSLENGNWQGRARTIAAAHQAAATDLGAPEVNADVCRALWDKVIPGILGPYDAPSMLRLFAGRPLLILNGDRDPNCPIEGAEIAFDAARGAFRDAGCPDRLRILVAKGVGHAVTADQHKAAIAWLERWLKP